MLKPTFDKKKGKLKVSYFWESVFIFSWTVFNCLGQNMLLLGLDVLGCMTGFQSKLWLSGAPLKCPWLELFSRIVANDKVAKLR